ncbi:type II secretion system protein [Candidatus Saccharibacteria bacterium]|nr:type II secretion system protein [Candidatus Saccharibacteria bacterium]
MAKNNTNSKQGFTIIEVVLVLAIAGLIFLMVFVALPALQRSQRDTQRRNDMSRVDTSLVQYQTNNSNKANNLPPAGTWKGNTSYPTNCNSNSACLFIRDYMNSGAAGENTVNSFTDPDGNPYSLVITSNWGENANISWDKVSGENATLTGDATNGYTINTGYFSEHTIFVVPGGKCDGEYVKKSERRHFAILYRLEGAGVYCIDDQ